MRSESGSLDIKSDPARVLVDSSRARAEMGAASPELVRQQWVRDCRDAILRNIEKMAEEGDRMAAIETGENAVAAIAAESGYSGLYGMTPEEIMAAANVALVPSSRPEIEWQGGKVDVRYEPGDVQVLWHPGRLDIKASRARVEFYLQQVR